MKKGDEEKKQTLIFETIHSKLYFQADGDELQIENEHQNIVCLYTCSKDDVHALLSYLLENFDFPIDVYIKPSQN